MDKLQLDEEKKIWIQHLESVNLVILKSTEDGTWRITIRKEYL